MKCTDVFSWWEGRVFAWPRYIRHVLGCFFFFLLFFFPVAELAAARAAARWVPLDLTHLPLLSKVSLRVDLRPDLVGCRGFKE